MGLDITAYSYLRPAPDAELEDGEPKDYLRFWQPVGRFEFRAGSYSGYGEWRNWLATVAGFRSAEDCWNRGKAGDPFFELIHFADNEGVIGPVVSLKLAADFRANILKAIDKKPTARDGDWYIDQYVRWWTAFMCASEHGAVEFH